MTSAGMQYYGLLGDYIGGVWGTAIGLLTLTAVFFTWRTSKKVDYRAKVYGIFTEMLRTHEEIVGSLRINERFGRDVLANILSEFYHIYELTKKYESDDNIWDVETRIDISYIYTYYGTHLLSEDLLKGYGEEKIKGFNDLLQISKRENRNSKRTFSGHQNRLSHYFRNIYSAYGFIEKSKLSNSEKMSLGKVLRSKLSNYEQAILAINSMSSLGTQWEYSGLLQKYKVIKNIPKKFLTFENDFSLKKRFPYIDFEWEDTKNSKLKTHQKSFFNTQIIIIRRTSKK